MWLLGMSSNSAGGLVSHLGSTIKSPWMCTVTSRHLSGYNPECCSDFKILKKNKKWKWKTNLKTFNSSAVRDLKCMHLKAFRGPIVLLLVPMCVLLLVIWKRRAFIAGRGLVTQNGVFLNDTKSCKCFVTDCLVRLSYTADEISAYG